MQYIIESTVIEDSKQALAELVKECLVCFILSEQPYLASTLQTKDTDEDTEELLRICKFLSAILEDGEPDFSLLEWSQSFEGRYHSIASIALRAASLWRQRQSK